MKPTQGTCVDVSRRRSGKTKRKSLFHPHTGLLSHHTAESETLPTKKWVSQWAHWKNSSDTCPSLSRDSTAIKNKVVRSTWPQSVTAPVKLWSSTSAAWRMCVLIPVGLFREWKTTTLSRSWSVRVGIMRENGDGMKIVWKWNCAYVLHMSQATITVEYYTDIGTAMTCTMTTFHQEILGKSLCAK